MISKVLQGEPKKNIYLNITFQKMVLGLFFFFALTMMIFLSSIPQKYDIKEGEVLKENIIARKDSINTIATNKYRETAANAVPKKYTLDHNITLEVKEEITDILNNVKIARSRAYLDDTEKVKTLKDVSKNISEETLYQMVVMSDTSLKELETITKAVIEQVMEDGIKEESIDRAKTYIIEEFRNIKTSKEIRSAGEDIAFAVITPNMVYDREATEKQQQEAMEAIVPVKIARNQVIIEKGTVVTSEHRELLKELGLLARDKKADISLLLGTALIALILEGVLIFAIYFFHKDLHENAQILTLLVLIILSTLIISLGFKSISNFLIPLAAGSMLISIFINSSVAVFSSLIMSIAMGIMLGNDFILSTIAFLVAIVGVFCTAKVSQRSDLTKAGGIIGGVNFILILGLGLLNNKHIWEILRDSPWGIVNGILSSILAIGTLPFLENVFEVTTPVKLLELSNPNQPLLRKLMLDAPGTYHHSIIVGNLAEAGAQAVGADSLLARVGANYHDIGKLKRPYFFIENQLTTDNPHDKLSPNLSALIITSHVKDGLDIAKEYHLPSSIADFIAQHHGTTLLTYFYNKALENNTDSKLDEASYRYEGPRPQTREVAIVMLADSVEAAVRSLAKPTPGKIEGVARQIIKDKLSDGQLDECDLTLKDLDKIASAFSKVLTGIFHTRIEYPDKLKELERREEHAEHNHK